MNRKTVYLILYLILVLAFSLRIYGINWDEGSHLHPDERAIVLSVLGLHFPHSVTEFLTPQSSWNTHFFAYGNFPFYLLRIVADLASGVLDPTLSGYDGIQLVGRFLSALFDVGTVFILFFLGRKIRGLGVGLFAAFFYAISVLPIQLSHFFAVDTPLTFFTTLLLYILISFYEKQSIKKACAIGIIFAFALATKISSLVLVLAIGSSIAIDFLLVVFKRPHKLDTWQSHFPRFLKRLLTEGVVIVFMTLIFYAVLSPYTFIDFAKFQQQTVEQSQMTKNAFTFPYTLQYVGKIPYIYELKNIILFGLGPMLAFICISGLTLFISQTIRKRNQTDFAKHLILLVFLFSYVIIVGGFSVGFMRYMLPVYPLLCLFGAIIINRLFQIISPRKKLRFALSALVLSFVEGLLFALLLLWPLSFMHIYETKHTRIVASNWIHENIKPGKTIAVEHWDDGLPLSGIEKYTVLTLPLYEPDTPEKWDLINGYLKQTDYIIIASNRLYVPLQKLTDCKRLPQGRCYIQTALYYSSLFNEKLGFEKVAEFASPPTIPFLNWQINDQGADESFTVYDHPKIMIFKKGIL